MGSGMRGAITAGVIAVLAAACSPTATTADSSPPETSTSVAAPTPPATTDSPSTTSPPPSTTTEASPAPVADATGPVRALVERLIATDSFSGVVLAARDGEVLWLESAGLANINTGTPIRPESLFNLGSMNKMFTAVAIFQLIEEGELALDGTVGRYLSGYPNADVAELVTIEHLLTHTSGMGDAFNDEFAADPHRYRTNEDFLALFVDEPLAYPPGEQWSYSNAGFVVLGLIIEEMSGMSYDEYMQQNVFEPSAMTATGAHDIEDEPEDLAIGYTEVDIDGNPTGVLSDHRPLMPGRGFAAGGGYSTAEDLHRFSNALLGYELLNETSTKMLTAGQVEMGEQAMYAFGFFDRVQAGQRVVGHSGGAPGVCSSLSMYPDSRYTVVILSNSDDDCLAVLDYLRLHPPE